MKGIRFAFAAAGLLVGVLSASGATATSVSAASAKPVRWFKIIALHSGKCLDVAHASTAHGANVIQGTCGGPGAGDNQLRRLKSIGVFRTR
jgi:hypothetical protein